MNFMKYVRARQLAGFHVCVGLDSTFDNIAPKRLKVLGRRSDVMFAFNRAIVDATKDYVCAFKPNVAFYSDVFGDDRALIDTIAYIHKTAPGIPVILDFKRADIGKTNNHYVAEADKFAADAITVNPYFGQEGLQPFLENPERGVIVLCRTSNKGAAEFQNRDVLLTEEEWDFFRKLPSGCQSTGCGHTFTKQYAIVAYAVAKRWNKNNNCALVVGATAPEELAQVRRIVGDMQILIPGIGAQGGVLEATVKAGADNTSAGMIINSSSGIIFASQDEDFAEAAGREAKKLNDAIKAILASHAA